jgi:hypothetical protein
MRRIFLMASMVAVIFALWAVSASACIFVPGDICAPAADSAPGNGAHHNNAPSSENRTNAPPDNNGTGTARETGAPAWCSNQAN